MKLAEWMKRKGFSFQDLAEESGVAKATIARITGGHGKEPHPGTKRKLAKTLGIDITDIDEFSTGFQPLADDSASAEGVAAALRAFDTIAGDEDQADVEREFAALIANYSDRASA